MITIRMDSTCHLPPPALAAQYARDRCWDAEVQAIFEETGEPGVDCILQSREELVAFSALLFETGVRSFLEIGIWTGRLVSALHRVHRFETVAACDHGYAQSLGLPLNLPTDCRFLQADSDSAAFLAWREALGPIDLVLIDANHHYHAVRRDWEINLRFPHRFLVLHDITGSNRHTRGVARLWRELRGWKREIVLPHGELGLDHSTMGIGVWSATPFPGARLE